MLTASDVTTTWFLEIQDGGATTDRDIAGLPQPLHPPRLPNQPAVAHYLRHDVDGHVDDVDDEVDGVVVATARNSGRG